MENQKKPDIKQIIKNISLKIILPIALVFIAELFYREPLQQKTLVEVPIMQQKKKLYDFFYTVSLVGSAPIAILFYAISFCCCPKPAALYLWSGFLFIFYLTSLLKSAYSDPRPFWLSDEISTQQCWNGFGSPSGHMSNTTFILVSMYLHKYYEVGVQRERMSVFCTGYIIKMGVTAAMCIFFIMLGLSRVYLGAHSYNQVVFGGSLGIVLAVVGHYNIKPLFLGMQDSMSKVSYQDGKPYYKVTGKMYLKVLIFTIILPFSVSASVYMLTKQETYPADWERRIRAACSHVEGTALGMHQKSLLHQFHFMLVSGAFIGQFFEWKHLVNKGYLNSSAWNWHQTNLCKSVLRVIVTLIVVGITFSMFTATRDKHQKSKITTNSVVLTLLPAFIIGWIMFAWMRYLFNKCRLDNHESEGREFEARENFIGASLVRSDSVQNSDRTIELENYA